MPALRNRITARRQLIRHTAWIAHAGLLVLFLKVTMLLAAQPEEVTFPSGKLMLHGFLYRPDGNGPFPDVLYNHGSELNPGQKPELARLFSNRGYVFFVPHRRSHGRSPNDAFVDSLYAERAGGLVALQETHSKTSWQPSPT